MAKTRKPAKAKAPVNIGLEKLPRPSRWEDRIRQRHCAQALAASSTGVGEYSVRHIFEMEWIAHEREGSPSIAP